MPSIDYEGKFHVHARSTAKDSTAAISFPVKASRLSTAMRFAEKTVLTLLPGWTRGMVRLVRRGKVCDSRVLDRETKET